MRQTGDKMNGLVPIIRITFGIFSLIIGFVGNVISFVIMRRKPLCLNSASVYFSSLAVIDTLGLYIALVPDMVHYINNVNIRDLNQWICKLDIFLDFTLFDTSNWILLAVTTDRFIAVWFPFKAKTLNTITRAKCVVLGLMLCGILKNLVLFWSRGEQQAVLNGTSVVLQCGYPNEQLEHFSLFIRPWIGLTLYAFVPISAVLTLNLMIVVKVKNLQKFRKSTSQASEEKNLRGMTLMLVSVSIAFLVLVTPNISLFVSRPYWVNTPDKQATYELLEAVGICLLHLNHSCNFFFYCLGAKVFRRQVFKLFNRGNVNPVETNTATSMN